MIAVCGAICQCSCGMVPAVLNVLPTNRVIIGSQPVASVMDFVPMLNIATFVMCSSLANPTVATATAAATAAALGVFTLVPMPCVPAISSPWIPTKPTVLLNSGSVVCSGNTCICAFGGAISINMPGQFTVT
ncbi:MAG: DUF4280 domain-containing protein [Holosporales bacterium]|nr:DUF4280 domain-containing protein [Holosporales bacterium]